LEHIVGLAAHFLQQALFEFGIIEQAISVRSTKLPFEVGPLVNSWLMYTELRSRRQKYQHAGTDRYPGPERHDHI
jgi:hypothetical protein